MATIGKSQLRWGELADEDDGDDHLDFLLPPKQVVGPDENGVKKVIEYKFDEDGNKVKITTTTRVTKKHAQMSRRALERRNWAKFGDGVNQDVGARLTVVSTEEIWLERPRAPGSKEEENKTLADSLSSQLNKSTFLMLCRTCGKKGEHWTSRCPYKDLAAAPDTDTMKPAASEVAAKNSAAYVPPSMRPNAERSTTLGSDMRRRNEENSVRVSNLSEDTREPDLDDLFRPFGPVSRVYVAIDQKTGVSRGFGFVNFVNREDGERAIKKLNGYGYDSLILHVEWATPRKNN